MSVTFRQIRSNCVCLPWNGSHSFVITKSYTCSETDIWCLVYIQFWYLTQARRQDLAAGGQKPEGGAKTQKGGHIFKIHYWMHAATVGPNVKWEDTDFKWGAGHHCLPRWRRPWPDPLGCV